MNSRIKLARDIAQMVLDHTTTPHADNTEALEIWTGSVLEMLPVSAEEKLDLVRHVINGNVRMVGVEGDQLKLIAEILR